MVSCQHLKFSFLGLQASCGRRSEHRLHRRCHRPDQQPLNEEPFEENDGLVGGVNTFKNISQIITPMRTTADDASLAQSVRRE